MDSKNSNVRLAKNTFLLYIRQFFVLVMSLYTSRLTLQVLGETDFGVYAAVGGFTALLSVITSSLASGTQRFMTFELGKGNKLRLNHVYCTSIQIHVALCLILLLIGETAGTWFLFNKMSIPHERVWIAFYILQFTLANSILSLTNVPNQASIIAHEDMGIYAMFSILDAILKLSFVISLFYITIDKLLVYAFSLFLIQLLNRLISEVWCHRRYDECKLYLIWNPLLLKSMLGLSGWAGLTTLSISVFIQGVNVLLNLFFGPVMNAAYSVAMQAYSGIRSFCSNFQLASNPQLVKCYASNDLKKMHQLLFSVCKMSFFLIFILSLPFLINSKYVLTLWLGNVPEHALSFFVLLLLYSYIDVMAYPLDISAQATGRVKKYSLYVSACVLLTLPATYMAYLQGCIAESIYIIAILMSWISLFIRIKLLNCMIGVSMSMFFRQVILKIILTAFLSIIIPSAYICWVKLEGITMFVTSSIIAMSSVASFSWKIGFDNNERRIFMNLFNSIKHRTHD